jgi:hypothetical protein
MADFVSPAIDHAEGCRLVADIGPRITQDRSADTGTTQSVSHGKAQSISKGPRLTGGKQHLPSAT